MTGARGALDTAGEWHYDAVAQQLFLWPSAPGAPSGIEVKQRNLAFDFSNLSDVRVEGLNLFAATIQTSNAIARIVLDGLNARFISHYLTLPSLPASEIAPGTDGFGLIGAQIHDSGIQLRGINHVLRNSRLSVSAGNLLLVSGSGHRIENNRFRLARH